MPGRQGAPPAVSQLRGCSQSCAFSVEARLVCEAGMSSCSEGWRTGTVSTRLSGRRALCASCGRLTWARLTDRGLVSSLRTELHADLGVNDVGSQRVRVDGQGQDIPDSDGHGIHEIARLPHGAGRD